MVAETFLKSLTDQEKAAKQYDWTFWARDEQLEPGGDWFCWLIKAGRGWGKTRTAAEWLNQRVKQGKARNIALVNDTAADVRDIMVEGMSGLLTISPPWFKPEYEPSKRRLTWPNGAIATCFAAESPEALRGPQHDTAWCDEPAKWKNLRKRDAEGGTAWDNLMFGLRVGEPRVVCSTTPRPIKWYKNLLKRSSTVITGGPSYDNKENLSKVWFQEVIEPQAGTRLGRQEIEAELMDEVPGALWKMSEIDEHRLDKVPCELVRVVVALDPSVTNTEESDECGIVIAGIGTDGQGYVLDDLSARCSPDTWANIACGAYHRRQADRIIGEANNGGDLIELTIRTVDENVSYKKVHASRGKLTRAEPVAALYEQGRVHHIGSFPLLEDEQTSWVPGDKSPNRMDALVWALTELMVHDDIPQIHSLA